MHSKFWYQNQNFGIIIQDLLFQTQDFRPQLILNLTPWKFKGISCIHPFNHFDKANNATNIFISLFASHRSHYHNYIDIYTDGSKTNDRVGCGIVCSNTALSYRLPAFYSVFSAEFIAIEISFKLISSYSHRHFIIYTDSKSVLDSLQTHALHLLFLS